TCSCRGQGGSHPLFLPLAKIHLLAPLPRGNGLKKKPLVGFLFSTLSATLQTEKEKALHLLF
ncbi:hypothetical protein, partial [Streptococcus mitis]|uniref:hypothetical protein n=1 Tax=Streptococcus mitis TaxID=28037 RepID=UPI001960C97C